MPEIELEKLADLIAAKLKEYPKCPHNISEEEARDIREISAAYHISKRTAIKVIVTLLIGFICTLLGLGFVSKLAEYFGK